MKIPPLSTLLSTFFLRYLAVERGVSPHTSTSYRDAIKLLLQFSAIRCKRSVDQLVIEDLNAPVVLDFLSHLETSRTNTVRTRNARLAADTNIFPLYRWPTALTGRVVQPCSCDSGEKSPASCTGLSERAGTRSLAGAG